MVGGVGGDGGAGQVRFICNLQEEKIHIWKICWKLMILWEVTVIKVETFFCALKSPRAQIYIMVHLICQLNRDQISQKQGKLWRENVLHVIISIIRWHAANVWTACFAVPTFLQKEKRSFKRLTKCLNQMWTGVLSWRNSLKIQTVVGMLSHHCI